MRRPKRNLLARGSNCSQTKRSKGTNSKGKTQTARSFTKQQKPEENRRCLTWGDVDAWTDERKHKEILERKRLLSHPSTTQPPNSKTTFWVRWNPWTPLCILYSICFLGTSITSAGEARWDPWVLFDISIIYNIAGTSITFAGEARWNPWVLFNIPVIYRGGGSLVTNIS